MENEQNAACCALALISSVLFVADVSRLDMDTPDQARPL